MICPDPRGQLVLDMSGSEIFSALWYPVLPIDQLIITVGTTSVEQVSNFITGLDWLCKSSRPMSALTIPLGRMEQSICWLPVTPTDKFCFNLSKLNVRIKPTPSKKSGICQKNKWHLLIPVMWIWNNLLRIRLFILFWI